MRLTSTTASDKPTNGKTRSILGISKRRHSYNNSRVPARFGAGSPDVSKRGAKPKSSRWRRLICHFEQSEKSFREWDLKEHTQRRD